jgi:hypothetical protein
MIKWAGTWMELRAFQNHALPEVSYLFMRHRQQPNGRGRLAAFLRRPVRRCHRVLPARRYRRPGIAVATPWSAPALGRPEIDGAAYVLYDVRSETFLLGANPDLPLAPASITKVMTASWRLKTWP